MPADLTDRVALVTGAASGIGKAIALAYARAGARVAVSDIAEEKGQAVADEIQEEGGEAIFVRASVDKPEESRALVEKTVEAFGALHIACNNAGIGGPQKPTADYEIEEWQQVISINLSGVFYGMKYQIPAIMESGGGSIVNMASILGQVGFPQSAAYVAAKHGMIGLTKSAALEYAEEGVRVNTVGPAFIKTPLLKDLGEEMLRQLVAQHPVGRLGESEEVAALVLWLSSEEASFCTGAYYPVDGGYLAR